MFKSRRCRVGEEREKSREETDERSGEECKNVRDGEDLRWALSEVKNPAQALFSLAASLAFALDSSYQSCVYQWREREMDGEA